MIDVTRRFRYARTLSLALLAVAAVPLSDLRAQEATASVDQLVADLDSTDARVRLRAVQALTRTAPPEAAVPLTRALTDKDDDIQFQAIAGELNIFLAEPVIPRKKVGLVVEVRNTISAPLLFEQGPRAFDPRPVPPEVFAALRRASHDNDHRLSLEALYAFGALSDNAYGESRGALLSASVTELVSALTAKDAEMRGGALLVIARLYSWRMGDAAVDERVGDAVVRSLNDPDPRIRLVAMDALGGLRFDRSVQSLTDIYQHFGRGDVATAALAALARIGHSSSVPLFVKGLAGRDASIRAIAIEGLARAGASDRLDAIHGALANQNNENLLLAGHFANVLLANGPVDELVGGLAREKLRPRALRYLADIAPGRARLLGSHVADPQAAVRLDLLDVIGLSGDPDGIVIAQRLQQDTDPVVARTARRAALRLQAAGAPTP